MAEQLSEHQIAVRLAELYERKFGGKERGRFRISMKHMRALTGRKRVPLEITRSIGEELFEFGYVLIDLETFFVVLAQRTFSSYRRVSDDCVVDMKSRVPNAPPSQHLEFGNAQNVP